MASGDKIFNSVIATRVATTTVASNSGTFTSTEVSLVSVTGYLEAGKRYLIRYPARFQSSVAGDNVQVRIREDSVSGNQLQACQVGIPTTSTVGFDVLAEVEFTAGASANKTFTLTGQRGTGTGNITMLAAASSARTFTITLIPT